LILHFHFDKKNSVLTVDLLLIEKVPRDARGRAKVLQAVLAACAMLGTNKVDGRNALIAAIGAKAVDLLWPVLSVDLTTPRPWKAQVITTSPSEHKKMSLSTKEANVVIPKGTSLEAEFNKLRDEIHKLLPESRAALSSLEELLQGICHSESPPFLKRATVHYVKGH